MRIPSWKIIYVIKDIFFFTIAKKSHRRTNKLKKYLEWLFFTVLTVIVVLELYWNHGRRVLGWEWPSGQLLTWWYQWSALGCHQLPWRVCTQGERSIREANFAYGSVAYYSIGILLLDQSFLYHDVLKRLGCNVHGFSTHCSVRKPWAYAVDTHTISLTYLLHAQNNRQWWLSEQWLCAHLHGACVSHHSSFRCRVYWPVCWVDTCTNIEGVWYMYKQQVTMSNSRHFGHWVFSMSAVLA